jgi:hypothetical protein
MIWDGMGCGVYRKVQEEKYGWLGRVGVGF